MDVSQAGGGREAGDDGAITPQQLIAELMTAIHSIGSQTKFAATKGVSQSLVSLTVTGKRGIDESIANALGYIKRVKVEYVPIQRSIGPAALTQDAGDARQKPGMGDLQPRPDIRHGIEHVPATILQSATDSRPQSSQGSRALALPSTMETHRPAEPPMQLGSAREGNNDALGEQERRALAGRGTGTRGSTPA